MLCITEIWLPVCCLSVYAGVQPRVRVTVALRRGQSFKFLKILYVI